MENFQHQAQELLAGRNPYTSTYTLNYPPLWLQLLYVFSHLSIATNLPLQTIILLFLVLCESILTYQMTRLLIELEVRPSSIRLLLLVGVIFNPVTVSQVCIHGHFDVLVALFMILAARFFILHQKAHDTCSWLVATLYLGLGILAKTVPAILLPLLALRAQARSRLVLFLGLYLALMPVLLGTSIIFVLNPEAVTKHVFGYRSIPGYFGITGLLSFLSLDRLIPLFAAFSSITMLGFMAYRVEWLAKHPTISPQQFLATMTGLLLFPIVWGSGFGPQYIMWVYPFLLILLAIGTPRTKKLLASSIAIISLHYLWEYGAMLLRSHGADFRIFPSGALMPLLPTPPAAADLKQAIFLARLPLFLSLLGVWLLLLRVSNRPVGNVGEPEPAS